MNDSQLRASSSAHVSSHLATDPRSNPASILLVDDQPARLLSYEAVLSGLGINCVRALSGEEALVRVLRQEFAAVVPDVSMRITAASEGPGPGSTFTVRWQLVESELSSEAGIRIDTPAAACPDRRRQQRCGRLARATTAARGTYHHCRLLSRAGLGCMSRVQPEVKTVDGTELNEATAPAPVK